MYGVRKSAFSGRQGITVSGPELLQKLPNSALQSTYSLVWQLNIDTVISAQAELSPTVLFKNLPKFSNAFLLAKIITLATKKSLLANS